MNNGFIFYGSFWDALKDLDDKNRLILYDTICEYALTGNTPDISGMALAMFKLIKPQIDANNKRREAGRKGGNAKAEANTQHEYNKDLANSSKDVANSSNDVAKEKEKEKVKENVKEKDKEKDKEKVKEKQEKEKSPDVAVATLVAPQDVKGRLQGFVNMRKAIKKPMTGHAVDLLYKRLCQLSIDPNTQCAILDQSIRNSWLDVYPLKDNRRASPAQDRLDEVDTWV